MSDLLQKIRSRTFPLSRLDHDVLIGVIDCFNRIYNGKTPSQLGREIDSAIQAINDGEPSATVRIGSEFRVDGPINNDKAALYVEVENLARAPHEQLVTFRYYTRKWLPHEKDLAEQFARAVDQYLESLNRRPAEDTSALQVNPAVRELLDRRP